MGLFSSIGSIVGTLTGDLWEDEQTRSYNKKNYKYNSWLQGQNEDFQKYMAENAHQMEMSDLQKAGLNPALTATGSSAGSIAGSSAGASTSSSSGMQMSNIVDTINKTRITNADTEQKKTQTKYIPQQINNETTSAKANLINAEANKQNAETQEKIAEGGMGGNIFGIENGGLLSSLATTLLPTAGIGLAMKGYKAFKMAKTAKGFEKFLKTVSSAK